MARTKATKGSSSRREGDGRGGVLLAIAIFKLAKGLLLLSVAVGALSLLNENVAGRAEHFVKALRVDPHNHFINSLLVKLTRVDNSKLEEISAGTFFYAALLLTEGVGLFLRKRWAEYFTTIATGSFIPLEIYELVKESSATKIVILAINVAVVLYLIYRAMHRRKRKG
jgi:uncharacterized membrane protein (DUF2068 family)